MAGLTRILAVALMVVAGWPMPARAEQAGAEALAERLLRAPEAQRPRVLEAPDFASVEVSRALLALGEKAQLDEELPRALLAFQMAEVVARRAGAEPEIASALAGAANALSAQGKLEEALKAGEENLRARERLGDTAGQTEAWNTIGHIRHGRAEYRDAAAAYQKALEGWTSAGDRRGSPGR